jgi:hypothetical protein
MECTSIIPSWLAVKLEIFFSLEKLLFSKHFPLAHMLFPATQSQDSPLNHSSVGMGYRVVVTKKEYATQMYPENVLLTSHSV